MLNRISNCLKYIIGTVFTIYLGALFTTNGLKNYLPLSTYILNIVLFLTIVILTIKVFQLENDLKAYESKPKTTTETNSPQQQNELNIVTNSMSVSVKSNAEIDNAGILNQIDNLTNK